MMYAVGIDLHGTLLEDGEFIRPELMSGLLEALRKARRVCRLFICTGNDLLFVRRKVPPDVLSLFDGMVLEHGCVLGSGDEENVLADADTVSDIKALEASLRQFNDVEVYKFARRLASIAIFTKYGHSPAAYKPIIEGRVLDSGYGDIVRTTYSSVAVDVVPLGFNKFTGLTELAGGLKAVGVADSMNDIELHLRTGISFAPSNISTELKRRLEEAGRNVVALPRTGKLEEGSTYVTSGPATEGVIEVLEVLGSLR
jgi:hydroxymethylpyrimidine pyrophosphatase-like HAD family hydrolase